MQTNAAVDWQDVLHEGAGYLDELGRGARGDGQQEKFHTRTDVHFARGQEVFVCGEFGA